jgi:hypothetical protein
MAVLNSFPSLIISCLLACISKRRPTDKGVSFLKDSILLTPRSNLFCVCTTTCRLISFEAWLLNVLVWKRKLLLILWIVLTGWQVESSASTPSFKCLTSSVRAPLSYHWSIHRLTSSYRTSTTVKAHPKPARHEQSTRVARAPAVCDVITKTWSCLWSARHALALIPARADNARNKQKFREAALTKQNFCRHDTSCFPKRHCHEIL